MISFNPLQAGICFVIIRFKYPKVNKFWFTCIEYIQIKVESDSSPDSSRDVHLLAVGLPVKILK